VLVLLFLDETRLGSALDAGELACPSASCPGCLRPWGHARPRRIQRLQGARVWLTPQRARCGHCRATHVLLPAWAAPRRGVDVATIATSMAARLRGQPHRHIGAYLGVPPDTVRGWLRRLTARAEELRCRALDHLVALEPDAAWLAPTGSPLGDALATLAAAVEAARRRFAYGPESVWPLLGQLGLSDCLAAARGS
jgi:hypothetical protein